MNLDLEAYRRDLTAYCQRILGSAFEAEDAVQETMVRAWRGIHDFEGRSGLRSWLYRIATNVCVDMLQGPQRRARPMDLGPSSTAETELGPAALPPGGDPAELAVNRDSIRLALAAMVKHLPPRQRSILILREVLRWRAREVAELLHMSVASVNSSLQRARANLAAADLDAPPLSDQQELLDRYVRAFERHDATALACAAGT